MNKKKPRKQNLEQLTLSTPIITFNTNFLYWTIIKSKLFKYKPKKINIKQNKISKIPPKKHIRKAQKRTLIRRWKSSLKLANTAPILICRWASKKAQPRQRESLENSKKRSKTWRGAQRLLQSARETRMTDASRTNCWPQNALGRGTQPLGVLDAIACVGEPDECEGSMDVMWEIGGFRWNRIEVVEWLETRLKSIKVIVYEYFVIDMHIKLLLLNKGF